MNNQAKLISVLFYSSEPVSHTVLCENFGISTAELVKLIEQANAKLADLGLVIIDNNNEVVLATQTGYAALIEEFYQSSPQPLSQAALEVLSIIAYKQPISKARIEEIRGVASEQSIKNLLHKQLIKKTVTKNKTSFITTTSFLKAMGLSNLAELPKPTNGNS